MMKILELKLLIDDLFQDYKIIREFNTVPNDRLINKYLTIEFLNNPYSFYLYNRKTGQIEFRSPRYYDYEEFYDELIIFKELILPKYL